MLETFVCGSGAQEQSHEPHITRSGLEEHFQNRFADGEDLLLDFTFFGPYFQAIFQFRATCLPS